MAETRKYLCIGCRKRVAATTDDHYRKHDREKGSECTRSKRDIPAWLLRRGPETGPEDETPVIGRDYANCPQCTASPVLDGATGHFTDHTREGETPTSPRVPCPMSGKPYESGESECPVDSIPEPEVSADTACAAPSSPASDVAAKAAPSALNESEEMISKWAEAAARATASRQLPPPFPESTTTQNGSPPRPSAPETPPTESRTSGATPSAVTAPASSATDAPQAASPAPGSVPEHLCHWNDEHGPHKWMHERRQAQCPGKPAPSSTSELGRAAVQKLSRKSAPTPDGTPADSAALTPAGAPVAPSNGALTPDAAPSTAATPPTAVTAPPSSSPFAQPGSPFAQPGKVEPAAPAVPMTVEGEQIAAALKQLFFDYCNRTERSKQKTLGPSGVGTPCDRKIAMTLLDIPAVNPGWIDKWASFVGTCIHGGLAEVFEWANAGTGRYTTEMPLTFPSASVPKGTGDLLDRTYASFMDHKSLSAYGVKKFKEEGPPPHHRIQVQVYAYGARLRGEVVDKVVIIGWPREGNSLNDLYVWVEKYDPQIARDALARVDRIAEAIDIYQARNKYMGALDAARQFPVADDCKFCNWYAPGDPDMTRGCPGRQ